MRGRRFDGIETGKPASTALENALGALLQIKQQTAANLSVTRALQRPFHFSIDLSKQS
jgi:hypothetical protein